MSQTKYLIGECQNCGGPIRFAAESIGSATDCPLCGQRTDLLLATPKSERVVPTKTIVFTIIAVVILIGGLVAAIIAVNRLKRTAEQRRASLAESVASGISSAAAGDSITQGGFVASAVSLQPTQGSPLAYAIGTICNETDRRRRAVSVELEPLDVAGSNLGKATDYLPAFEPKAEWQFKTSIPIPATVQARIVSITRLIRRHYLSGQTPRSLVCALDTSEERQRPFQAARFQKTILTRHHGTLILLTHSDPTTSDSHPDVSYEKLQQAFVCSASA